MKDLKTLSEYVDTVYGWGAYVAYSSCYHAIKHHNEFLKTPLHLGQFVPCNAEGEPMEEPKPFLFACSFENELDCSSELELCACDNMRKYIKAYEKAKEAVIFEGWEVVEPEEFETIKIATTELEIRFTKTSNSVRTKANSGNWRIYEYITTINDLAEATTDKKIKLK